MRIKTEFLIILMTAMVCVSFSGCGDWITADKVYESSDIQYNIIAPPENGWTDELIDSVLYVDGKPFSIRSNIDDMQGFVWDSKYEDEFKSPNGEKMRRTSYMTNGDRNLLVIVDMEGNILTISSASEMEDFRFVELTVNGITVGSDYSEVIANLGLPNEEEKSSDNAFTSVRYVFSGTENDVCLKILFINTEDGSSIVDSMGVYNSDFYNE